MTSFLDNETAVDFIAGQAWLSPKERVTAASVAPRRVGRRRRIGWRQAAREIREVLSRTSACPRHR